MHRLLRVNNSRSSRLAAGENCQQTIAVLHVHGGKLLAAHVIIRGGGAFHHALPGDEENVRQVPDVRHADARHPQRLLVVLQPGQHARKQLPAILGLDFVQRRNRQGIAVAVVGEDEQRLVCFGHEQEVGELLVVLRAVGSGVFL